MKEENVTLRDGTVIPFIAGIEDIYEHLAKAGVLIEGRYKSGKGVRYVRVEKDWVCFDYLRSSYYNGSNFICKIRGTGKRISDPEAAGYGSGHAVDWSDNYLPLAKEAPSAS